MFLSFEVKSQLKKNVLWCWFELRVFLVTCKRRSLRPCSLWFGEVERSRFTRAGGAAATLWTTGYWIGIKPACVGSLSIKKIKINKYICVCVSSCCGRMWVVLLSNCDFYIAKTVLSMIFDGMKQPLKRLWNIGSSWRLINADQQRK